MDVRLRNLKGSPSRDTFKQRHKALSSRYYSCDVDLSLVSKSPPGVVAFVDYKKPGDIVTFSEVLLYNELLGMAPVYIVEAENPEVGPFVVKTYLGGNWRPHPPTVDYGELVICANWQELGEWEGHIRDEFKLNHGVSHTEENPDGPGRA